MSDLSTEYVLYELMYRCRCGIETSGLTADVSDPKNHKVVCPVCKRLMVHYDTIKRTYRMGGCVARYPYKDD